LGAAIDWILWGRHRLDPGGRCRRARAWEERRPVGGGREVVGGRQGGGWRAAEGEAGVGSIFFFGSGCWRMDVFGSVTLCCAAPKPPNGSGVWVSFVGDSLSTANLA
jgi:hypothetical protein